MSGESGRVRLLPLPPINSQNFEFEDVSCSHFIYLFFFVPYLPYHKHKLLMEIIKQ